MSVYGCVHVCAGAWEARDMGPLGVGVVSGCEPPAGNLGSLQEHGLDYQALSSSSFFFLFIFLCLFCVCIYGEHCVPQQECGGQRTL